MQAIADTDRLVADGIISPDQAREIEARARGALVFLGINTLLCVGIIAATFGLIFWLANAIAVAISGTIALAAGLLILTRAGALFRMFGNAAALIGAGMLIGGAGFELIDKYEDIAGWVMLASGLLIVLSTGWSLLFAGITARFVVGAILLMGIAIHITGFGFLLSENSVSGLPTAMFYLYVTIVMLAAGWTVDIRLVTALAIVPFAQALDVGTFYFHAAYVFYSPEPTLSILQMALLIGLCVWIGGRVTERSARHARVLAVLAFVMANLCALIGSLWGDVVGETIWGPGWYSFRSDTSWEEFRAMRELFRENTLVISEHVYSVLWAVALVAMILWAAYQNQRGLFNAALTFGAIHAYTQMFESFADEPLAYVIGGLAAIPLAWGIWRLDHWLTARTTRPASD